MVRFRYSEAVSMWVHVHLTTGHNDSSERVVNGFCERILDHGSALISRMQKRNHRRRRLTEANRVKRRGGSGEKGLENHSVLRSLFETARRQAKSLSASSWIFLATAVRLFNGYAQQLGMKGTVGRSPSR